MGLSHQIIQLRAYIETFCFHKRQKLIVDVLWDEIRRCNPSLTPVARRKMLIEHIDHFAQKEMPNLQEHLDNEKRAACMAFLEEYKCPS